VTGLSAQEEYFARKKETSESWLIRSRSSYVISFLTNYSSLRDIQNQKVFFSLLHRVLTENKEEKADAICATALNAAVN
jgi:hypothetical protein